MTPGPRVAILGAGRAGAALHASLSGAGIQPVLLWTRREETAAAARAEGLPARSGPLPALGDAGIVFLAVDDGAVGPLATGLARTPADALLVHLAGALDLGPLGPWHDAGGPVGSFHPLQSIPNRSARLQGTVAIDASSPKALATLGALAAALGLSTIHPIGDRARYHAAAALVGNFPQVLLAAAQRLLEECGLTPEEARRAFGPLLESAARNAATRGPADGLTGPVLRGDVEVVARHLRAIAGSGDVEALYRAATRIAADLAETRGAARVGEVRRLVE